MSIQQNHNRRGRGLVPLREILLDIVIEDGLTDLVFSAESIPEDFKRDLRLKIQGNYNYPPIPDPVSIYHEDGSVFVTIVPFDAGDGTIHNRLIFPKKTGRYEAYA